MTIALREFIVLGATIMLPISGSAMVDSNSNRLRMLLRDVAMWFGNKQLFNVDREVC